MKIIQDVTNFPPDVLSRYIILYIIKRLRLLLHGKLPYSHAGNCRRLSFVQLQLNLHELHVYNRPLYSRAWDIQRHSCIVERSWSRSQLCSLRITSRTYDVVSLADMCVNWHIHCTITNWNIGRVTNQHTMYARIYWPKECTTDQLVGKVTYMRAHWYVRSFISSEWLYIRSVV